MKIEIDDEVREVLEKLAVPLVDTANSVLRRVLGIDPPKEEGEIAPTVLALRSHSQLRTRRVRRSATPQIEFEIPILQALVELGGKANISDVLARVKERMLQRFTKDDLEEEQTGRIRWHHRAEFARLELRHKKDLRDDSPRGVWEITEKGRRRVQHR